MRQKVMAAKTNTTATIQKIFFTRVIPSSMPAGYSPPNEKSSKAVTLSALVHTPMLPVPEI
jgi:hypothetical protein